MTNWEAVARKQLSLRVGDDLAKLEDATHELKDALWQPGYFLCTTGQVTLDDLKEYVENQ